MPGAWRLPKVFSTARKEPSPAFEMASSMACTASRPFSIGTTLWY